MIYGSTPLPDHRKRYPDNSLNLGLFRHHEWRTPSRRATVQHLDGDLDDHPQWGRVLVRVAERDYLEHQSNAGRPCLLEEDHRAHLQGEGL
jgi:hypothetical protein